MNPLNLGRVFNRVSCKGSTSALFAIREWATKQNDFQNLGVHWSGIFDKELLLFFETNNNSPVGRFESISNRYWDVDFMITFENIHTDLHGTAFVTKGRSLISEHHE